MRPLASLQQFTDGDLQIGRPNRRAESEPVLIRRQRQDLVLMSAADYAELQQAHTTLAEQRENERRHLKRNHEALQRIMQGPPILKTHEEVFTGARRERANADV